MNSNYLISIIYGDGIGPEIMDSVLSIFKESEVPITLQSIPAGLEMYRRNHNAGISDESMHNIKNSKALLKAPITTPLGMGYSSINVKLRKNLGLYANIRPVKSYFPYIDSKFSNVNLTIIRENEEDLYSGIEYRNTQKEMQAVKLISEGCSKRIINYAFEYAKESLSSKVACFAKDNIMKLTDGMFHNIFNKASLNYKDIESSYYLVDIGSAKLASNPGLFEVIVTTNLYGDIISDIAAEISGSIGLAGSSNIGSDFAMFEAVHGSAPDIKDQDIANPSGLINASIMMLNHLGLSKYAEIIDNALRVTIEDGYHTKDISSKNYTNKIVGTKEFTKEIIKRLGQKPKKLKSCKVFDTKNIPSKVNQIIQKQEINSVKKSLFGADIYFDINKVHFKEFISKISKLSQNHNDLKLECAISRGLLLWKPEYKKIIDTDSDSIIIRYNFNKIFSKNIILKLLKDFEIENIDYVKIQFLYQYSNDKGYFTP